MSEKREYLGDGVYVRFDGYSLHIAVNDHKNEVVVFEPEVLESLNNFYARCISNKNGE